MNVGGFFEHQNKMMMPTNRECVFTARVSQVNVNTMKGIFEQRFELQAAKCLIVLVLSSSYIVSSHELRNKRNAAKKWSFLVANDIVLTQVRV